MWLLLFVLCVFVCLFACLSLTFSFCHLLLSDYVCFGRWHMIIENTPSKFHFIKLIRCVNPAVWSINVKHNTSLIWIVMLILIVICLRAMEINWFFFLFVFWRTHSKFASLKKKTIFLDLGCFSFFCLFVCLLVVFYALCLTYYFYLKTWNFVWLLAFMWHSYVKVLNCSNQCSNFSFLCLFVYVCFFILILTRLAWNCLIC